MELNEMEKRRGNLWKNCVPCQISKEKSKTATELAYAEVISYNKKNLEREFQNESRQHNRQQSRTKGRAEELR